MVIVTNPELLKELGPCAEGEEWIADKDSPDASFTSAAIKGSLCEVELEIDAETAHNEAETVKVLAGRIKSNRHLRKIIKEADPAMREQVYELFKPHLTFTPLSYLSLKPR